MSSKTKKYETYFFKNLTNSKNINEIHLINFSLQSTIYFNPCIFNDMT